MSDVAKQPDTPHGAAAATASIVAVAGALGIPHALGLDADQMTLILGAIMACVSTVYAVLTRHAKREDKG